MVIRELDTVGGVTIDGEVDALSINNSGQAVFLWSDNHFDEVLFGSCDAANLATTAFPILTEDVSTVDIDGDQVADADLTNFNASSTLGNGLNLAEDGFLYVEVMLDYGQGEKEAIIKVPVCCGNGVVDGTEACDGDGQGTGGETATCNTDCTTAACGDLKINATAGEDCDDGAETATCNADCTVASCGDGVVNATAGEDCDDSGESATCNDDCTTAACGDEIVNVTAGEDCDNGGTETGGCDDDCTFPECGDGVVNAAAGEDCDDGDESATCDLDCTDPECGDSVLNTTAGEECEDGNTVDGDGCSSTCEIEGSSSSSGTGGTGGTTSSGTGGTTSSGTGGTGGTTSSGDAMDSEDDGGCGCRAGGTGSSSSPPLGPERSGWAGGSGSGTATSPLAAQARRPGRPTPDARLAHPGRALALGAPFSPQDDMTAGRPSSARYDGGRLVCLLAVRALAITQ